MCTNSSRNSQNVLGKFIAFFTKPPHRNILLFETLKPKPTFNGWLQETRKPEAQANTKPLNHSNWRSWQLVKH